VNAADDDRHPLLVSGETSEDARLGPVGVNDPVSAGADQPPQITEGAELSRTGVAHEGGNAVDRHVVGDGELLHLVPPRVEAVDGVDRVFRGAAVGEAGDHVEDRRRL